MKEVEDSTRKINLRLHDHHVNIQDVNKPVHVFTKQTSHNKTT
jgi:hypothetical protein